MQTIPAYLYQNTIQCQIVLPNDLSATRSVFVYSNPIKIYKNIDNPIRIVFRNKDQKRTRINTFTFVFYLFKTNSPTVNNYTVDDNEYSSVDYDSINVGVPVLSKSVTVLDDGTTDSTKGVATVTLTSEELAPFTPDSYVYSIKAIAADASEMPAYSDDNMGVTGTIYLIDNAYPVL